MKYSTQLKKEGTKPEVVPCLCNTVSSPPFPIKSPLPGSAFFWRSMGWSGRGSYEVKFKEVPVREKIVGTRIVYQAEPELAV